MSSTEDLERRIQPDLPLCDKAEFFIPAGTEMLQYLTNYHTEMQKLIVPVLPEASMKPGDLIAKFPSRAPEKGEQFTDLMLDVKDKIMPAVTHWHHPLFFAYFPTSTSYASILADMLSGGIACIGFSWIASPACTELEVLVLDWLVRAMGLPEKFLSPHGIGNPDHQGGGVIQDTASSASLMMVLSLRSQYIRKHQKEDLKNCDDSVDENENDSDVEVDDSSAFGALLTSKMVAYVSDQAHSSVTRACNIAMVRVRQIKTTCATNRQLNVEKLKQIVKKDKDLGLIPLICFASMGSTNSCAFDDIEAVGKACNELNLWCHVDAAYAGSSLLCEEYRYLAKGLDFIDSFNFNPHKMMRVSFDASCLWVRDRSVLVNAFNVNPTYLHHEFDGMPDYRHWQLPLGRRFRALKLWFVLRLFGIEGLRNFFRNHCNLAQVFQDLIEADERFEIVNKVELGLVCFRLKGPNKLTKILHEKLMESRKIYLVCGKFSSGVNEEIVSRHGENELLFLRFVTCSYMTTKEDVTLAYDEISKFAKTVLEEN